MKKATKQKAIQKDIANANKRKKLKIVDNSKQEKEFFEKVATECFGKSAILNGLQNTINKKITLTSEQKQIANNIKIQVKNYNAKAKEKNEKTTNFKNMLLQNKQIDEATKKAILIFNNINCVNVKDIQKEYIDELTKLFEQINKSNKISLTSEQNANCKTFIDKATKEKINTIAKQIFSCDCDLSFNDIRQVYQKAFDLKPKSVK